MPLQILSVVAPLLIMTAIGYLLERRRVPLHGETLSSLVLLVGTPALIFSTLTSIEMPEGTIADVSLAALLVVGLGGALAAMALRVAGLPLRTFLPSLTIPNSGNIGLPVALLAFGDAGLAVGISFFYVVALLQYTIGTAISSGRYRLAQFVRDPLIYAVVAVLVVRTADLPVPTIVAETTRLLGGMTIPMMVILLGASLSRLKIADMRQALALAVVRLAIGLACGVLVPLALGLRGIEAAAVFLAASMPAAVVTYVFAARYRPDSERVAGLVVVSTVMTFAALPAQLWIAFRIEAGGLW